MSRNAFGYVVLFFASMIVFACAIPLVHELLGENATRARVLFVAGLIALAVVGAFFLAIQLVRGGAVRRANSAKSDGPPQEE